MTRKISNLQTALITVFLLLTALLAGCAGRPARVAADVEMPDAFSSGGSDQLPEHWWEGLGDPRLNDLERIALAGSPTLLAARDRLDQAAALARAAGASQWPAVNAEIGGSRNVVGYETSAGDRKEWSTDLSMGLQASYEIDLWGRVGATAEAATLDAVASAEDLRAAAVTLTASVAETWYQLVAARESLELVGSQLGINEQTLEIVTARFRNGQVGAVDVLQQRQLVEAKRGELARSEARAVVLANELAVLLGESPGSDVIPDSGDLVALPSLPATGIPAELVQRRPDVRAGFARILAADARAAAAAANRFPRLSLSASVSSSAERVDDFFADWLANLAANLTMPLIDGGGRAAESDRTRAAAAEKFHAYGGIVLAAVSAVENALINEDRQQAYLRSLEKQAGLSSQTVERVRQGYLSGSHNYLRVLSAILTDQALGLNRIEAKRQLISYRIQLCRALAGGWELESGSDSGTDDSGRSRDSMQTSRPNRGGNR